MTYVSESEEINRLSIISTALCMYFDDRLKNDKDINIRKGHDYYKRYDEINEWLFEKVHGYKRFGDKPECSIEGCKQIPHLIPAPFCNIHTREFAEAAKNEKNA